MGRTKREEIPLPVRELPVQHLQLSNPTARAAAPFRTIGGAAKHLEDKRSVQLLNANARKELLAALGDLRGCIRRDGAVDLGRFYAVRPVRKTCGAMYYVSEHLQRPVARQAEVGIGELQLRVHIAQPLIKSGITTLTHLLRALRAGLSIPAHGKQRYIPELLPRLTALEGSIDSQGNVDWNCFAKHLRIPIAGYRSADQSSEMFLPQFYAAASAAIRFQFGEAAHSIARQRLLVTVGEESKLADIGRLTGMTKEGVRLWEATVLAALRRIIWHNDYTGWRCRLTNDVRRHVRHFLTKFSLKNRSVFLRSDWSGSARDYFNVRGTRALIETRLLVGLAGLTPFRFPREITWTALATNDAAMPRLRQARALINKTLSIGCPDGLPLAKIHDRIAQSPSRTVSAEDVRCLLSSLPDIKYNNKTRRFRLCESKLRLHDALEQTLRAAGEPVSLSVFQQRFRDEDGRPRWTLASIVTEIAKDPRFVPVGLTGKRALREWTEIERRSIADIAAEIMQSASAPVSEAQLFAMISKRRSLSFGSIRSLLLHDRRFRRVSPGWWAPAA